MPGQPSGRFTPFKYGPIFGKEDQYGINDGYINGPDAILRNWQKGKKSKLPWKGTKEQAEEMCALLNRDKKVMQKATQQDQSARTRAILRNKPRTVSASALPQFKRCPCGAMYKGEKHCDG